MALIATVIIFIFTNPKTVQQGMVDGINICLSNLIPSLFPLFFLIGSLAEYIPAFRSKVTRRLFEVCGLINGTESLFLLSLISGYPVGAVSIKNRTAKKAINRDDACRLMGFCNNAGPAFIFGLTMTLFTTKWLAWIVWGLQIISSILVAVTLPKCKQEIQTSPLEYAPRPLTQIMLNSIKSIALVCGWVMIFQSIMALINLYAHNTLSPLALIIIKGILELTNGCIALGNVENEAIRFVLFNTFLSFGGICVWMQIISSADELISPTFFIGKGLQILYCAFFSLLLQRIIFYECIIGYHLGICLLICLLGIVTLSYWIRSKKTVAKPGLMMYNARKTLRNEA